MPIVHVYSFDRSVEAKRNVIRGITEVMCREYKVRPENITVKILPMERDHVAHGGHLVSDRPPPWAAPMPASTPADVNSGELPCR